MTQTRLDAGWNGLDGIVGGYVLAVAVDHARLDGFRPQSVTMAFVSTVRAGDCEVVVDELHTGRSSASLRLELSQEGRLRAHGLASMVRHDGDPIWEPPPAPVDRDPVCTPPWEPPHLRLPYLDHFEVRSLGVGSVAGGERVWMRTRTDDVDDLTPHARLVLHLDVLPPGLFSAPGPPSFVPSLEMTAHFSPRAASAGAPGEWLVAANRTVWSSGGYCVDEGTLHTREGHLVAQLRQGRQVRR